MIASRSFGLGARANRRMNRRPSRIIARAVPWLSVVLASLFTMVAWVASAPILPPFGLLTLIAWRQVRPGLLPLWAGLPLGLVDDCWSGQPFGSAVMLWSCVMLALEWAELHAPWRGFAADWALAALLIAAAILLGAGLADLAGGRTPILTTLPQIGFAVLTYPIVARIVARLDRLRLVQIVDTGRWP